MRKNPIEKMKISATYDSRMILTMSESKFVSRSPGVFPIICFLTVIISLYIVFIKVVRALELSRQTVAHLRDRYAFVSVWQVGLRETLLDE